jgi:hypothetical protein
MPCHEVDDDASALAFAGDGLIASCEIDDAESRMPECDPPVSRDPVALPVRAVMVKAFGGALDGGCRDRAPAGDESDNSTHAVCPWNRVLALIEAATRTRLYLTGEFC